MEFSRRETFWRRQDGAVEQVAVAYIDPVSRDVLAEACELVGPFDDAGEALQEAACVALNLARRQLVGQLSIDDVLSPPTVAGITSNGSSSRPLG